jgi:hypothetical protein
VDLAEGLELLKPKDYVWINKDNTLTQPAPDTRLVPFIASWFQPFHKNSTVIKVSSPWTISEPALNLTTNKQLWTVEDV